MANIQQPHEIRKLAASGGCGGGCSGKGTGHGPFPLQETMATDTGTCRVDEVVERKPLEIRKADPAIKEPPSTGDWVVDFMFAKAVNLLSFVRSLYYAGRSLTRTARFGLVSRETYHNRRLYCTTCEHYYVDYERARVYCGYDPRGCGCPKIVDLFVKLRLVGYKCPDGRFGNGSDIQPPVLQGEFQWLKQSGKVALKERKAIQPLSGTGQTDSLAAKTS